ncbi:AAA family ATPase [Paenibacillus sp. R14(2021)]|uniref:AAA family ATPase n=1 Tax=Paenibacillus sp. R14(2021) TaxID=2859228 RepID=UPI001C6168DB|nr:AAA family ATPase [Paenibacillus sp. R14(2021)]
MRLQKLHLEGFGQLSGKVCDLQAPVTVFYGPNEAGKSTMLGFIRAMLFGYANKGNRAERLEPVNGGRHGGRLFFSDETGRHYVLERYGSASGKIVVRATAEGLDDGTVGGAAETITQQEWERTYLGGVNERVFRELFAITLSELQAIGMLEGDELGKQLYHTGWNGGNAIARTEKRLLGQMDELFKPRGSTQQMSKLLKTLEETEAELRKLEDGIAVFNALTTAIDETEAALKAVSEKLPLLRDQHAGLARAVELRPIWIQRQALLQEKATLGEVPRLAGDARSRWEALTEELHRVQEESRRLEELAAMQQLRLSQQTFDPNLIASRHEVNSLLLAAQQIAAARHTDAELAAEMREHADAVQHLLLRISPAWSEETLRGFRIGVADREAVRGFREALSDGEKALREAEAEHRAVLQQEREAGALLAEFGDEATAVWPVWPVHADRKAGRNVETEATRLRSARKKADAEDGEDAYASIFRLLPETAEALHYASRQFEEAWRELELALLREQHEAGAASAQRSGREAGASSAVLLAAGGIFAAGAAALAAAGMPAAAAAAGAAGAALAAPALLRLARSRGTAARGAGRPAWLPRPGKPPPRSSACSRRSARSSPRRRPRFRCCCRARAAEPPPRSAKPPLRGRGPGPAGAARLTAAWRRARPSCSRACAERSTRGRTSSAAAPAALSGAQSSRAVMPGCAHRNKPPSPRQTTRSLRLVPSRLIGMIG